jgi:hypothetical protein
MLRRWKALIAASHQRGSTLFLPHLFSLVPVPSLELCIANSKIDLFVVHSFGMIHLLTSQILHRVYEFTYPRIHEDNPITSEYSARSLVGFVILRKDYGVLKSYFIAPH